MLDYLIQVDECEGTVDESGEFQAGRIEFPNIYECVDNEVVGIDFFCSEECRNKALKFLEPLVPNLGESAEFVKGTLCQQCDKELVQKDPVYGYKIYLNDELLNGECGFKTLDEAKQTAAKDLAEITGVWPS